MLKVIGVLSSCLMLTGCILMPGMRNLNTSQIRVRLPSQIIQTNPILIPITPSLLLSRREASYHYRVAPADILSIHVWQHPEFDFLEKPNMTWNNLVGAHGAAGQAGYLVNSSGQINFPLLGYVSVAGNTLETVQAKLTARLRRYVPDPQVNVRVADYRGRKAYVIGEVMRPGFVPFTDQPLTIADALALVGGINSRSADPRYIYVIRGDFTAPQIYWLDAKTPDRMLLAKCFRMQPQDILFVAIAPIAQWNRVIEQLVPTVQPMLLTQSVINGM
ncbi:MAG: polysaccharide biosynthesis/export family protein [Legionella sp.]|nr:polysaccharide biosynthesis/export family protein [Legionella sp.]